MARIPKNCWMKSVVIEAKGAEASYDCDDEYSGGRGTFPLTRGQQGFGNYRKAWFPKVREVSMPDCGMHASGTGTFVGFEQSPRKVHCKVQRSGAFKTLSCKVKKSRR